MDRNRALWIAAAALGVYALVAVSGGDIGSIFVLGLLAAPVVGAYLLFRQMKLGVAAQRAARDLADQGGLQYRELLERGPNGRVLPEVAEVEVVRRRAEVDQAPDDWRSWFRYAAALGDAGQGREARSAMRQAVVLHQREERGDTQE